jgi:hypothetical protein
VSVEKIPKTPMNAIFAANSLETLLEYSRATSPLACATIFYFLIIFYIY